MRTLPALLLAAAVAVAPAACTRSPAAVHDDTQGDHAAHVDHAAHHDHAAPEVSATAAPADAPRFATDTVLRTQMAGIRDAVEALAHHEMGHMTADQARGFAVDIETRVQTIIAECRLPPAADAALHEIIVPLLQNAIALKTTPADTAPVARMRAALAEYARRFDDADAAGHD